MKRFLSLLIVWLGLGWLAGAQTSWQNGRIEAIKKSVGSTNKTWVANAPLENDITRYTISVHLPDKILTGSYELSKTQSDPPMDWAAGYAVEVSTDEDTLYLRSLTGRLRLHITQRKTTGPMDPLTADEKRRLAELDAPVESMVGYSKEGENKAVAPESAPTAPTAPVAASSVSVTVRSTPFLSEVFVDGESVGYTPAKIALAPGKHKLRVEKPGYRVWKKEMTVAMGPELTVDASLERK